MFYVFAVEQSVRARLCVCVCMHVCKYAYMCVCMCVCARVVRATLDVAMTRMTSPIACSSRQASLTFLDRADAHTTTPGQNTSQLPFYYPNTFASRRVCTRRRARVTLRRALTGSFGCRCTNYLRTLLRPSVAPKTIKAYRPRGVCSRRVYRGRR